MAAHVVSPFGVPPGGVHIAPIQLLPPRYRGAVGRKLHRCRQLRRAVSAQAKCRVELYVPVVDVKGNKVVGAVARTTKGHVVQASGPTRLDAEIAALTGLSAELGVTP